MVKHYKDTESMVYYEVDSGQKFRLLKESNHHKFLGADVVSRQRLKGGKVKYELRVTSYKFKSASYEFKSTSYEFKFTS